MTYTIRLNLVDTRCAASLEKQIPITTGGRGEFRVVLHGDESWEGLDKTVVFRAGQVSRSQYIGAGVECLVPPDVLSQSVPYLEIGVYGTSGADIVRTTTWGRVGGVLPGATPTDDLTESLDLYAQLLAEVGAARTAAEQSATSAQSSATSAQESADAAEAARKGAEITAQGVVDVHNTSPDAHADLFEQAYNTAVHINDDAVSKTETWSSQKVLDALCPAFEESGGVVQCYPVEGHPLGAVSTIEAVQEGEGDPSPENVRPIVGWDTVEVTRCGANLLDTSQAIVMPSETEDVHPIDNGIYVRGWGMPVFDNGWVRKHLKPGARYVIKYKIKKVGDPPDGYDLNFSLSKRLLLYSPSRGAAAGLIGYGGEMAAGDEAPVSETFTAPSEIGYVSDYRILAYSELWRTEDNLASNQRSATVEFTDIMLSPIDTPYEPYQGNTYSADLPETVYGGTYNWETGELVVTHENIASYNGESVPDGWISSTGQLTEGAQVVYPLADPIVFCLTPQQISALAGTNTLHSSTGDTAVTGRSDPIRLTQSLMDRIAALEQNAIS